MEKSDLKNKSIIIFGEGNNTLVSSFVKQCSGCCTLYSLAAEYESCELLKDINDIIYLMNPFVLIVPEDNVEISSIVNKLNVFNIPYDHLTFYINAEYSVKKLLAMGQTCYIDASENMLNLSEKMSLSGDIVIAFRNAAKRNHIVIGEIKVDRGLRIDAFGNDGLIDIGDQTTFVQVAIASTSNGRIIIGKDCMLSHSINLSQADQHHIFDIKTGNRINNTKDIIIGDHVWLGRGTMILGGAKVGSGCMVGANCTTASKFPCCAIIVGNPGKVIRESIVWTRDMTGRVEYSNYEACKGKVDFTNWSDKNMNDKLGKHICQKLKAKLIRFVKSRV